MSDESRLERYLAERAEAISLAPVDPSRIVARAERRRQRRRTTMAAAVVLMVVGATAGLLATRDEPQSITLARPEASRVPAADQLDWTVVRHRAGLGYANVTTMTDDGALYALSSAPGLPAQSKVRDTRAVLYRSDDGLAWTPLALPEKLWATNLAAIDDRVYAVGTGPAASGSIDIVVNSMDGAGGWAEATLPLDLGTISAEHPEATFHLDSPSIVAGARGVLVATVVRAQAGIEERIRARIAMPYDTWVQTETGIDVLEGLGDQCSAPSTVLDEARVEVGGALCGADGQKSQVIRRYSWAELGISPELQPYLLGRLEMFWSPDGLNFEAVPAPAAATIEGKNISWVQLTASPDGFELFYEAAVPGQSAVTGSVHSADGRTWARSGFTVTGASLLSAGLINDQPAAVVSSYTGDGASLYLASGGDATTWTSLDLAGVLGVTSETARVSIHQAAIGPLGAVALVDFIDGNEGGAAHQWLVHSPDGKTAAAVPLDKFFGPDPYRSYSVLGIAVTADAVIVRVTEPGPRGGRIVPAQQLLVGTPRG